MSNEVRVLTDSYWNLLKPLDFEVKLRLAARLANDVADMEETSKKSSAEIFDSLCGIWEDDRTAEEIIADIKSTHSSKTPVKL